MSGAVIWIIHRSAGCAGKRQQGSRMTVSLLMRRPILIPAEAKPIGGNPKVRPGNYCDEEGAAWTIERPARLRTTLGSTVSLFPDPSATNPDEFRTVPYLAIALYADY